MLLLFDNIAKLEYVVERHYQPKNRVRLAKCSMLNLNIRPNTSTLKTKKSRQVYNGPQVVKFISAIENNVGSKIIFEQKINK